VAHPTDAIGALSPVRRCPTEQHVGVRDEQRETVFGRDRRALTGETLGAQDIAGENSGYCGNEKGKGQRVSVAKLTGMEKRSIDGPRGLIGIAVMP
jgi:hypothetical protein